MDDGGEDLEFDDDDGENVGVCSLCTGKSLIFKVKGFHDSNNEHSNKRLVLICRCFS